MIFPFTVKHNGVLYEPGKRVPIGQEPKKELQAEDKTASELSKELKEKFDIDMAPQKGKAKLQEALEEAEKKAKDLEPEEDDEELDGEEDLEDNKPEDDDKSFLEKIINE